MINSNLIDLDRLTKTLYLSILLIPINMTLSGLLLIYLVFATYKIKSENIVPKHIKNLFIIFIIYSFFQTILTYNPVYHIGGVIGHYIIYLLFFNILGKLIKTEKDLDRLINYIISSGFILAILGIIIYFSSDFNLRFFPYSIFEAKGYLIDLDTQIYKGRASGISMNPNILGVYLFITTILSLNRLNDKFKKNIKNSENNFLISYINIFIQIFCLFFSYSRGAIVSLFIVFLLMLKSLADRIRYSILLIFAFLFTFNISILERLFNTFSLNDNLDISRLFVWKKTLQIIYGNWQGVGILSFENMYKLYNTENYKHIPHAHNWYLQTIVESGIVGSIILFSFYFSIIYYLLKNLKNKNKYIAFCLIGFSIFNLTDYVLSDIRITLILTMLIYIGFLKIEISK